jgi:hypothetical protein
LSGIRSIVSTALLNLVHTRSILLIGMIASFVGRMTASVSTLVHVVSVASDAHFGSKRGMPAAPALKQEDKVFGLRLAEDWIKVAQQADEPSKRLGQPVFREQNALPHDSAFVSKELRS